MKNEEIILIAAAALAAFVMLRKRTVTPGSTPASAINSFFTSPSRAQIANTQNQQAAVNNTLYGMAGNALGRLFSGGSSSAASTAASSSDAGLVAGSPYYTDAQIQAQDAYVLQDMANSTDGYAANPTDSYSQSDPSFINGY